MAFTPASAGFDLFYMCSNIRAVTNCESLVKDFYSKLGLQYRDSSSEDEASQPTEIIEIPDEDDDVLSIDSGKRWGYGLKSLWIETETWEDEQIEDKRGETVLTNFIFLTIGLVCYRKKKK